MKKIYFISGLGADEKAFNKIGDFVGYTKVFIPWISNKKEEPLSDYCDRLFEKYQVQSNDVLVGLSFGGIIAQEISRKCFCDKIVLISSLRSKRDLKTLYRVMLNLHLHKLIPNWKMTFLSGLIRERFNVRTKQGREVIRSMVRSTDPRLVRWSLEKIRTYKESDGESTIYNIIGTSDNLMKVWKNKNTFVIKGGGHFMVYENAEEINGILRRVLVGTN